MSKLTKRLLNNVQPKLGTLITINGNSTMVGEETFKEMMTTHYPNHENKKPTWYDKGNRVAKADLTNK